MKAIRFLFRAILLLGVIIGAAWLIGPRLLDRPYYLGPETGHFDGERFFNPTGDDTSIPPGGGGRTAFFRQMIFGSEDRQDWPTSVPVSVSKPVPRVEGDAMIATWVGHATVLIQTQGVNILTDPIWADRAGPFGIGPKRVTRPGIAFADLPKIDLIVVSHNHYDHMDLDVLKRLWDRDRPLIVTSLGNDTLMREAGIEARALDWDRARAVTDQIDVVVTRNHHWSSRWFVDRNRALWSSFVIRTPAGNIMFAGDTGFGDGQWPAEAARYGPVRLALIPIGAFRFRNGQMHTASHIGPIQAVEVFARSAAAFAIPIHWGTFQLSFEARETPPIMLAEVLKCRGIAAGRFAAAAIGRPIAIPAYVAPPPVAAADADCLADPRITGLR